MHMKMFQKLRKLRRGQPFNSEIGAGKLEKTRILAFILKQYSHPIRNFYPHIFIA